MDSELNFLEMGIVLLNKLWIILTCSLLFGIMAFLFSRFYLPSMYDATVTMNINNTRVVVDPNGNVRNIYDTVDIRRLITSYSIVIKSNTVLEAVIEKSGLTNMTPEKLGKMFTLTSVQESEVFKLKVSHKDPNIAANIANNIAHVAPDELKRIVKVGNVEIIDYAVPSTLPSSPNVPLNITTALVAGLLFSAILVLIIEYANTSIRSEDELEQKYEIAVLGSIPTNRL